jgi:hypothetical protein
VNKFVGLGQFFSGGARFWTSTPSCREISDEATWGMRRTSITDLNNVELVTTNVVKCAILDICAG